MSSSPTPVERTERSAPPPRSPEVRLSDADREATAGALHAAVADGRLDLHEFEERLDAAYAARVPSELAGLLDDLGGVDVTARRAPAAAPARLERTVAPAVVGVLAIVAVVALGVLVTPHLLWFLWLAIPFARRRFGEAGGHAVRPADGVSGRKGGWGCGGERRVSQQAA